MSNFDFVRRYRNRKRKLNTKIAIELGACSSIPRACDAYLAVDIRWRCCYSRGSFAGPQQIRSQHLGIVIFKKLDHDVFKIFGPVVFASVKCSLFSNLEFQLARANSGLGPLVREGARVPAASNCPWIIEVSKESEGERKRGRDRLDDWVKNGPKTSWKQSKNAAAHRHLPPRPGHQRRPALAAARLRHVLTATLYYIVRWPRLFLRRLLTIIKNRAYVRTTSTNEQRNCEWNHEQTTHWTQPQMSTTQPRANNTTANLSTESFAVALFVCGGAVPSRLRVACSQAQYEQRPGSGCQWVSDESEMDFF